MTKQEFIKNTYINLGFNWELSHSFVDENGWVYFKIDSSGISNNLNYHDDFKIDRADVDIKAVWYVRNYFYWRIRTLKDIDDNNGWIKINSIDDLPKPENGFDYYQILIKDKEIISVDDYWAKDKRKDQEWLVNYSHYKEIPKTDLPLY